MAMQDASKQILEFVGSRKAFAEILIGPKISGALQIDDRTRAVPLGPVGNGGNVQFGCQLLTTLGIPNDQGFRVEAQRQGALFNESTAVIYIELPDEDFVLAAKGQYQKAIRYRALLALYAGGAFTPVMRIKWIEPKLAHVEFLPPKYRRGLSGRHSDDPISDEFVRLCAGDHAGDDQLHYFISLLEQASELSDEQFRIARLYSLLETMAGSITSQFERQLAGRPMTRTAIRFMTGYFMEFDIPRFTVGETADFEFDHIELAGNVRHKIFHGGGTLQRSDVPSTLRVGVDLLHLRPDLLAHALRRDCENELSGWAKRESRAWQAKNGKEFDVPVRDPNYDGRTLAKRLISSPAPFGSPIGSVNVKVTGVDIGIVRLQIAQSSGEQ